MLQSSSRFLYSLLFAHSLPISLCYSHRTPFFTSVCVYCIVSYTCCTSTCALRTTLYHKLCYVFVSHTHWLMCLCGCFSVWDCVCMQVNEWVFSSAKLMSFFPIQLRFYVHNYIYTRKNKPKKFLCCAERTKKKEYLKNKLNVVECLTEGLPLSSRKDVCFFKKERKRGKKKKRNEEYFWNEKQLWVFFFSGCRFIEDSVLWQSSACQDRTRIFKKFMGKKKKTKSEFSSSSFFSISDLDESSNKKKNIKTVFSILLWICQERFSNLLRNLLLWNKKCAIHAFYVSSNYQSKQKKNKKKLRNNKS